MSQSNPSDGDSQEHGADASIEVDLSERDPAKSIIRTEAAPVSDEPIRTRTHNADGNGDLTKAIAKRMGRLQSQLTRQFDQQLAERDALHQRELRDIHGKLDRVLASRGSTAEDADELEHERKIASLEEQLADALEKGESRQVAKLQSAISAEHARFSSAQTAKLMGEGYIRDQEARFGKRDAAPDNGARSAAKPTPLGKRFINDNGDWWNDPDFRAEKREAVAIDQDLIEEGYDPNTQEHYEELQNRLGEKFPDLEVVIPTNRAQRRDREDDMANREERPHGRVEQRPIRGGSISAGANRGGNPAVRRNGAVRLDADRIENMKRFGLDPNNDKHVAEYAANVVG